MVCFSAGGRQFGPGKAIANAGVQEKPYGTAGPDALV